jgi:hypothetical protein
MLHVFEATLRNPLYPIVVKNPFAVEAWSIAMRNIPTA